MEIDVTHLVEDQDVLCTLSGSQAEWGADADSFTWENSRKYAEMHHLIDSDEKHKAAVAFLCNTGYSWDGSDKDDRAEVNTLITQYVAGSLREYELFLDEEGEIHWESVLDAQSKGIVNSDVYPGDDGRFYFYMGS